MSDNLRPGMMRTYVKVSSKTESKSPSGIITRTWTYAFHFYARILEQKASESWSATLPGVKNTLTLETWWRSDLKRDMRISLDEIEYDITDIIDGFKTITIECVRVEQ